jgi:hypothetical protein
MRSQWCCHRALIPLDNSTALRSPPWDPLCMALQRARFLRARAVHVSLNGMSLTSGAVSESTSSSIAPCGRQQPHSDKLLPQHRVANRAGRPVGRWTSLKGNILRQLKF